MKFGFVGLGQMGAPMAISLAAKMMYWFMIETQMRWRKWCAVVRKLPLTVSAEHILLVLPLGFTSDFPAMSCKPPDI